MPITNDSKLVAIRSFIITAMQNEMNVGPGGPGTGANMAGRLQSLKYVHKTIHLWSDDLPAAGVQIVKQTRTPWATRTQKATLHFRVAVAASAPPSLDGITLDAAQAVLDPLLEDGGGNGVLPVVNGLGSMGDLANYSRVDGDVLYDWDVDKAVGATDARMYAYVPLLVDTYLSY